MNKPNFIKTAQEKIKKAVNTIKRKHDGKDVITTEALTGIYFEMHPGVEEIHSGFTELRDLAGGLGLAVISDSELNKPTQDMYVSI